METELQKNYEKGAAYWMGVPSTVNGMLGGYEHISQIDAKGTVGFLSHLPRNITVADCGAGIGRVTQTALLKLFKSIDLVEQSSQFLETAKTLLKDVNGISYICTGLQEFMPAQNRYGLIWIQWVAGHLPDDDLVSFLIRCGFVGIKENVAKTSRVWDEEDASCTRNNDEYLDVFSRAGMKVFKKEQQLGFPTNLYPVYMYLLQ